MTLINVQEETFYSIECTKSLYPNNWKIVPLFLINRLHRSKKYKKHKYGYNGWIDSIFDFLHGPCYQLFNKCGSKSITYIQEILTLLENKHKNYTFRIIKLTLGERRELVDVPSKNS